MVMNKIALNRFQPVRTYPALHSRVDTTVSRALAGGQKSAAAWH